MIDGYKPINAIPIELGGVRSYLLEEKPIRYIQGDSDEEDPTTDKDTSQPDKKHKNKQSDQLELEEGSVRSSVAVICKVKFET
jgi:hypothetical protein